MELGSNQDAAREQTAELRGFVHVRGRVGRSTVPGVPTADGFTYPGPNPQDANALFREGRCLLLVGDQESAADYRAPVIAAVRDLGAHRRSPGRVHGLIRLAAGQARRPGLRARPPVPDGVARRDARGIRIHPSPRLPRPSRSPSGR